MNDAHQDQPHDPRFQAEDHTTPQDPLPVAASTDYEAFVLIRLIDGLLAGLKGLLSPVLVDTSCSVLARLGMWAVLVFAALTLVGSIVIAAQSDSFSALLGGVISAVVALGLLYTAGKFCNAGQRIIETTETQFSSRAFLDSIALLSIALALGSIIAGINFSSSAESLYPLGIGIGVAAWWFFLAAVAFHPELANCSVHPGASAGKECIGIVAFLVKAKLRLVPIVFGVAAVTGTLLYLFSFSRYLGADEFDRYSVFAEMLAISGFINTAAALPLVIYIGSLFVLLLIDTVRAILRTPGSN